MSAIYTNLYKGQTCQNLFMEGYAVPEIFAPGQVIDSFAASQCSFYCVVGSGLDYPVEVFFADAGFFRVRGGVAKIDGIGYAIADGQFDGVKVITEHGVDAENDLFHLLQSIGTRTEIRLVAKVVRVARFIGHDPDVFSADAITAVVFCEDDLFLQQHDQLACLRMLMIEVPGIVQFVDVLPAAAGEWFHIRGEADIIEN